MKVLVSIVAVVVAAVAFALYAQNRELRSWKENNQALQTRVAELELALDRETRQRNARESEGGLGQAEKLELMRLRNEVTQLRGSSQAAADAEAENARLLAENRQLRENARANQAQPATPGLARDHWTFQGYATPEAAVASALWAARDANPDVYIASLTPEARQAFESEHQGKSPQQTAADLKKQFGSVSAFHVSGQKQVSPTEMDMQIEMQYGNNGGKVRAGVRMTLVGNEWKAASPLSPTSYDPMTFYRKNPELMRRYFPHLFQGEGGAQVPAQVQK